MRISTVYHFKSTNIDYTHATDNILRQLSVIRCQLNRLSHMQNTEMKRVRREKGSSKTCKTNTEPFPSFIFYFVSTRVPMIERKLVRPEIPGLNIAFQNVIQSLINGTEIPAYFTGRCVKKCGGPLSLLTPNEILSSRGKRRGGHSRLAPKCPMGYWSSIPHQRVVKNGAILY
ncbi:hypothetical protein PoB_003168900 [Plakobranchus ocellatus]|uniref:Uncharacterized protein n=1 Tax=Plakobranchus ocellatus TaxID=259542 RepID=A0AAV4AFI2_9GAST|nr:hypothetical protein PoB_003168900 [Plakobranchus ocellatus]